MERVRCFIAKGFWAEFVMKEDATLPLSGFVERSFLLNLGNRFYTEHRNALVEAFGEDRIEKREEECPYLATCEALQRFTAQQEALRSGRSEGRSGALAKDAEEKSRFLEWITL